MSKAQHTPGIWFIKDRGLSNIGQKSVAFFTHSGGVVVSAKRGAIHA